MTQQHNSIPEGYLQNASGHLVPISKVKEFDLLRNNLVLDIVERAKAMQLQLQNFKTDAEGDAEAFIALSAEQYGVNMGGKRGNVTLTSFDGSAQIKIAVQDRISFDERLQVAKTLVDECIHSWTEGSNDNIRALVEHAFQTDKEGQINIARVYSLLRLEINDDHWKQAMTALRESMQVVSSKSYMRIYQRDQHGKYQQVSLDMAGL